MKSNGMNRNVGQFVEYGERRRKWEGVRLPIDKNGKCLVNNRRFEREGEGS
jgi:hypothetical protein